MYGLKVRFFNFAIMSSFPLKYKKRRHSFLLSVYTGTYGLGFEALKIDTLSDFI